MVQTLRDANIDDSIRGVLTTHGRMASAASLKVEQDLYEAGLTSFSAVQVMLALEEAFDVEFPEKMLNRRSFASIAAIAGCITEIRLPKVAA